MKYLFVLVFACVLSSCGSDTTQLEKENAELRGQVEIAQEQAEQAKMEAEKAMEMAQVAATEARKAEAQAMAQARLAEKALEDCKGKN